MKHLSQNLRTGRLSVDEVICPELARGHVLVQTKFSLISAGTERDKIETGNKSLIGKALKRPDQVEQVIRSIQQFGLGATLEKVKSRLDARSPLGYSAAGLVLEVGDDVDGYQPGDLVACGGASAAHAEIIVVPKNLVALVPEGVLPEEAAFTTVGAIALHGIRQANLRLGETAVVIGLGLLGQLTTQILKAAGCSVIGYDPDSDRVKLSLELGANGAASDESSLTLALSTMTGSSGADAVIITAGTPSSRPVALAGELCRDKGRVVAVGVVGLDLPRPPYFDKELDFCLSRSYGPGRYDPNYEDKGLDYPYGFVRWTEQRNMVAFLKLVADRKVNVSRLITHRFPLEQADEAYSLIREASKEKSLGILFTYSNESRQVESRIEARRSQPVDRKNVAVGVLGAGNFAQSMLLPPLKANPSVSLKGVTTRSPLKCKDVSERFGFEFMARNADEIFKDEQISAVLIATRHDSHASLVVQALKAGKAVHVEKPLAMSREELDDIVKTYQGRQHKPFVTVGFNRRFAPMIEEARRFYADCLEAPAIQIRVNAGHIPLDHWSQDAQQGGGRIIGEVCHFIDLAQFLSGFMVKSVYAKALPNSGKYRDDNVAITLEMKNGAIANVLYVANGDRRSGKERIEIYCAGRIAIVDDYQYLEMTSNGKRRTTKRGARNKGHQQEMERWVQAVLRGEDEPVPFLEAVAATRASFAVIQSLHTGAPVDVNQAQADCHGNSSSENTNK